AGWVTKASAPSLARQFSPDLLAVSPARGARPRRTNPLLRGVRRLWKKAAPLLRRATARHHLGRRRFVASLPDENSKSSSSYRRSHAARPASPERPAELQE